MKGKSEQVVVGSPHQGHQGLKYSDLANSSGLLAFLLVSSPVQTVDVSECVQNGQNGPVEIQFIQFPILMLVLDIACIGTWGTWGEALTLVWGPTKIVDTQSRKPSFS